MPYVEIDNKILTKIRGVATGDGKEGRQQMLKEMSTNPERVDLIFVKGIDVFCVYTNEFGKSSEWHLGYLKDKYRTLLFNNYAKITSWYITGGHRIFTMSDKSQFAARLGINLEIELRIK